MSTDATRTESGPGSGAEDVDPITFTVIYNRLDSVAEEMTLTLERSAWTSILALARDYSCAIYDAQLRQIAMKDGVPVHTTSMHIVLGEIAAAFGDEIYEGDVIACNDPYSGNTHVGDFVTACPVFVDGKLVFWTVTKGHQLDVGAYIPTSVTPASRDKWQEGLTVPPIKFYERGKPHEDVINLYLSNMRYPELLRGDLYAQLGSVWKGEERLLEMIGEYGVDEVQRYVDEIINYAHRRTSATISEWPDGVYEAEGWVDSDGVDLSDLLIKVRLEVDGDMIHIDYTGSAKQGRGGCNGSLATMTAAGAIQVLMCLDADIPRVDGSIRHITSTAQEGSVCWAKYPASTSLATIVPTDCMQDVVNKALALVVPDRVAGGTAKPANCPTPFGVDQETGEPVWGAMIMNNDGGGGATLGVDGWPLMAPMAALGGLKAMQIEQLELAHPLRITQWEVETDSAGHGQWVGGPGTRFSMEPAAEPFICTEYGDGRDNPPHGILGGMPGFGGGAYVENRTTGRKRFLNATNAIDVGLDETWVGVSSGGGGYGDPLLRDPAAVARDVRDEIVSPDAAREIYGVVLTEALEPEALEEDTVALRERLLASRGARPNVDPAGPHASTWLRDNMTEQDEYLINPSIA
jgi:N-methylhydantoinase B